MMSSAQVKQYDVLIVGAGIVGSALACSLGNSSLRVGIVEAKDIATDWPEAGGDVNGFDPRVSALTAASQNFLDELGCWSAMQRQRVSPYQYMHVWDAEGTGFVHFDAAEINQPALGHIVENRITATALMQRLQQRNNVELIVGHAVAAINEQDQGYLIELASGQKLQSRLLVAADGANSTVRSLLDIPIKQRGYEHSAIVATVQTEKSHQATAWQRFLPEGPLAFLPLIDLPFADNDGKQHISSIVWSAETDYAEQLMKLDDETFAIELGCTFENQLGAIQAVSRRFCFPLIERHVADYVKPGLALVGDAAHTIHPLAGQGVNLGLMDAMVLAEELLRAERRKLDVGSAHVLSRFQRRRKGANVTMMMAMDGFKRLFEHDALTIRWARNTGMRWFNKIGPLKKHVMRSAMGL